jgi:hypothetical protein
LPSTTIRKASLSIGQSAIIVPEKEKKVLLYGSKLVIRKKPHVINAALLQNIQNSLTYFTLTVILPTVDILI